MPDIICEHGALDPQKAHNMKRMSKVYNCDLIKCCCTRRFIHFRKHTNELFPMGLTAPCEAPRMYAKYVLRSLSRVTSTPCFLFSNSSYLIERLYQIQHPRIVAQFDKVCDVEADDVGFWISKVWLKGHSIEY